MAGASLEHRPWGGLTMQYPLKTLEWLVRFAVHDFPKLVLGRTPGLHRFVGLAYMYMCLEVLAIFWAFLLHAGSHAVLRIVRYALQVSETGATPFWSPHTFATFYTCYSACRMFAGFAGALWNMAWESLSNFPSVRKVFVRDRRSFVGRALLLLVPLVSTTCLLLLAALTPDQKPTTDLLEPLQTVLLALRSPAVSRSVRIIVLICFTHWLQFFLFYFPRVTRNRHVASSFRATFLSIFALVLVLVTLLWSVAWLANVAGLQEIDVARSTVSAAGAGIILLWMLWAALLLLLLEKKKIGTVKGGSRSAITDQAMRHTFVNMKFSLCIFGVYFFLRDVIDPNIGFVAAQKHLISITVTVPCIYALLLRIWETAEISIRSSFVLNATAMAIAAALAKILSEYSHVRGALIAPILFVDVFSHMLQNFGTERAHVEQERLRRLRQRSPILSSASGSSPGSPGQRDEAIMLAVQHHGRSAATSLTRCGLGLAGIVILFCLFASLLAHFQERMGLKVKLTSFSVAPDHLAISHTSAIKLKLIRKGYQVVMTGPPRPPSPRYAMCDHRLYGLSILDYSLIAEAAYFDPTNESTAVLMHELLGPSIGTFKIRVPSLKPGSATSPSAGITDGAHLPQYFELRFPNSGLRVVSIRGTDPGRLADFLEDVRMFVDPVALSLLSFAFPTIRMWSGSVAASVVALFDHVLLHLGLRREAFYYEAVVDYVREIPEDESVVIVGHSLGGGIARLVGALTGRPSVTISPPGVTQHSERQTSTGRGDPSVHRRMKEALHHQSLTLVPAHDPVSMVDVQTGAVQNLLCSTEAQALQNSCHMLEGTICEWLQSCGDDRSRFSDCVFSYDLRRLVSETRWYESAWEASRELLAGNRAYLTVATSLALALLLATLEFLDYCLWGRYDVDDDEDDDDDGGDGNGEGEGAGGGNK